MLARLRSLFLKTPALVALGLVLAYLLFSWFGFGTMRTWMLMSGIVARSTTSSVGTGRRSRS